MCTFLLPLHGCSITVALSLSAAEASNSNVESRIEVEVRTIACRHSHVHRERETHCPPASDTHCAARGPSVVQRPRKARHLVRPAAGMVDHEHHRHAGDDGHGNPSEETPSNEESHHHPCQVPATDTIFRVGGGQDMGDA